MGCFRHFGQLVGNGTNNNHPVGPAPPPPVSGAPPYATDPSFPGQAGWVVEAKGSLPLGPDGGAAYWDFLFKDAASNLPRACACAHKRW